MTSTPVSLDYTPSASCDKTVSDDHPRRLTFMNRLARLGIIWGMWTIVALFFSTQVFMMYYSERQPIPYKRAFIVQFSACYLWALVTPLVLWLARRFCIDRSEERRVGKECRC